MKKKLTALICTLAVIAPAGCSSPEPAAPVHTHAPLEGWDRNATEHWHNCECGEKLDTAAHELDDLSSCTVCGSEIIDWGDGTFDVYNYDENGSTVRGSSFSRGGELLQEYIYEREYDAEGNPVTEKVFTDGVLTSEVGYTTDENGTWQTGYTDYYEDGGKTVVEYDFEGNITHAQHYNADGTMASESFSEYAYDDNGNSYEASCTEVDADGSKWLAEYNQYEDVTLRQAWDADGTLRYTETFEYGYNEEGKEDWRKEYQDGRLVYEILNYVTVIEEDGWSRFPENTVEYFENGTKMALHYNSEGNDDRKIWYDVEGNVVYEVTMTYEYDAEGNLVRMLTWEGETVIMDSEYQMDSDGWTYLALETELRPDGTKLVREYDENGEILSETEYGKG